MIGVAPVGPGWSRPTARPSKVPHVPSGATALEVEVVPRTRTKTAAKAGAAYRFGAAGAGEGGGGVSGEGVEGYTCDGFSYARVVATPRAPEAAPRAIMARGTSFFSMGALGVLSPLRSMRAGRM